MHAVLNFFMVRVSLLLFAFRTIGNLAFSGFLRVQRQPYRGVCACAPPTLQTECRLIAGGGISINYIRSTARIRKGGRTLWGLWSAFFSLY